MSKILVHLHLYYHDQVDFFIDKLKNIDGVDWDLIVTYSSELKQTTNKILNFKKNAQFLKVDNVGYDILPFIQAIRSVNPEDYSLVLKLHTKRGYPKQNRNGQWIDYSWRNSLVDSLIGSKQIFNKNLKLFEKDPQIGMVSSLRYYQKRDFYDQYVAKELNNLGLYKKDRHTAMGAMFLIRADVLSPLKSDSIRLDKFYSQENKSGQSISMAHIYERIFSHLPVNFGLRHKAVAISRSEALSLGLKRTLEETARIFFVMGRKGPSKKKIIKIFGIKIYESKRGKAEADAQKLKELFNE